MSNSIRSVGLLNLVSIIYANVQNPVCNFVAVISLISSSIESRLDQAEEKQF